MSQARSVPREEMIANHLLAGLVQVGVAVMLLSKSERSLAARVSARRAAKAALTFSTRCSLVTTGKKDLIMPPRNVSHVCGGWDRC